MTTSRSEEMLVGIVALLAAAWVAGLIRRALRSGVFIFPRWRIERAADPARFRALLAAYGIAFVLMCVVSVDLLMGLD